MRADGGFTLGRVERVCEEKIEGSTASWYAYRVRTNVHFAKSKKSIPAI